MKIAGKNVGGQYPCFIIAEAGSNHNRDFKLACQLIDAAKDAGADAVKFQLFTGEKHYSRKTPPFEYLAKQGITKNIVDLLKEIELPLEWVEQLRDYAKKVGIIFFCSVTSKEDIDLANRLGLPLFKLASFEIVDLPLITYAAAKGKPVILSTGLCNMEEIQDAFEAVQKTRNKDLILLQCASMYPSPASIMNLNSMATLRKAFQVEIGLSDHTPGVHIAPAAVAMGAKVIEKHFTISRKLKGPDHPFAIEPHELKQMVEYIRDVEAALGDGVKNGPSKQEQEMFTKARRSIHAAANIAKGSVITADKLTIKRPGYGIKPKFIDQVIGKISKVDIEEDTAITWENI